MSRHFRRQERSILEERMIKTPGFSDVSLIADIGSSAWVLAERQAMRTAELAEYDTDELTQMLMDAKRLGHPDAAEIIDVVLYKRQQSEELGF